MYIKQKGSRIIRLIVLIIAILIALLTAILMLASGQAFQDWTYDNCQTVMRFGVSIRGYKFDKTDGDSSDHRLPKA